MQGTIRIAVLIAAGLVLGGCAAAMVAPLIVSAAVTAYGGYKVIQTSTGGSVEIAIDQSKVSDAQRAQLRSVRKLAVWPEKTGGAVMLADALVEGDRFEVISPSRVAAALNKLGFSDNLALITARERNDVFLKVCVETGADALISDRAVGGSDNLNMWSFERANITREFLVFVFGRRANETILTLPVAVRVLVGGTIPSSEEVAKVANGELAKTVIALSGNYEPPPAVAGGSAVESANVGSNRSSLAQGGEASRSADAKSVPGAMTVKEAQERLIALGYRPGKPDGLMGKATTQALRQFQQDRGLAVTGAIDPATAEKLRP
jgi:hypothetical protein